MRPLLGNQNLIMKNLPSQQTMDTSKVSNDNQEFQTLNYHQLNHQLNSLCFQMHILKNIFDKTSKLIMYHALFTSIMQ
jgi:hypothetical protein